MNEFRKLRESEIQVRPTDTKTKGCATLLLYKDARVDMDILDESVGPENWAKEYYEVKGNLFCRVGIKTEEGWVWKADCGIESNMDAQKGEASDAFKRACFNWGIGRELYTTPRIKVKCPDNYYYNEKLTMTFAVRYIRYEGKQITELAIEDKFGNLVFNWNANATAGAEKAAVTETDEARRLKQLAEWFNEKKKDPNYDRNEVIKFKDHYKALAPTFKYKNFDCNKLWGMWLKGNVI